MRSIVWARIIGAALCLSAGAYAVGCANGDTGRESGNEDDDDDGVGGTGGAPAAGGGGAVGQGGGAAGGGGAGGGTSCIPQAEVCDGVDNDCNNVIDEGCACTNGQTQTCYTGPSGTDGVGPCKSGTQTCVNGQWSLACAGQVVPGAEKCDGEDNNCSGVVDDVPGVGFPCMTGSPGVCAQGTLICAGNEAVCEPDVAASPEVCDGLDNDCNGAVDDGAAAGVPCMTGGLGACAAGTQTCLSGMPVCSQSVQATSEVCGDSVDNDCNGATDEGCPCNPKILLLGDNKITANQAIQSALTAAGLFVTLVNSGVATYADNPAASSFGAVVILAGEQYDADMPFTGQNAIVNAWNSGSTGFVTTEFAAYKPTVGLWTTLGQLLILNRSGELAASGLETYTQVTPHPVWSGLPATFTTLDPSAPGAHNVGVAINGGTSIANITSTGCATCPTPGVVVKEAASRTVQIAHSASWSNGEAWVNDTNLVKMMTNAAKWASGCTN